MTTKIALFVVAGLIALSAPQHVNAKSDYLVAGVGNDTCGTFVTEAANDTTRYQMEISWIQGFVTAENVETIVAFSKSLGSAKIDPDEVDTLVGLDYGAQKVWLEDWCSRHSLEELHEAAAAFSGVLVKRLEKKLLRELRPHTHRAE